MHDDGYCCAGEDREDPMSWDDVIDEPEIKLLGGDITVDPSVFYGPKFPERS